MFLMLGRMEFTFGIIRFDLVLCELWLGAHALLNTYIHPVRTHKVLDKIWWFQRLITSSPSSKTLFLNFISLLCIQYSPSGDWVHITALLIYVHPPSHDSQSIWSNLMFPKVNSIFLIIKNIVSEFYFINLHPVLSTWWLGWSLRTKSSRMLRNPKR